MTAVLFVTSLVLERLASSPADIPPPHSVDRVVQLIDRILPLPKVKLKLAPFIVYILHIIEVEARGRVTEICRAGTRRKSRHFRALIHCLFVGYT